MLDLDHLSRQTGGNHDLQRQVLTLFVRQADTLTEHLRGSLDERGRREAAHAIMGSARAIGALDVARIAAQVQESAGAAEVEVAALVEALSKTREFIVSLLAK